MHLIRGLRAGLPSAATRTVAALSVPVVLGLPSELFGQAARDSRLRIEGLATTGAGEPIEGATVVLLADLTVVAETVSGPFGAWFFDLDSDLPDLGGEIMVLASAEGLATSAPASLELPLRAPVLLELWRLPTQDAAAEPGQILGRVRDDAGRPIADVLVSVDGAWVATTGATGGFDLPLSRAGGHTWRFEHVGYETVQKRLTVIPGGGAFLDVTLPTRPVELPEITVTAIPRRGLADVESLRHRIRSGIGDFTTAEDLAVRGFPSMRSYLQGLPGLRFIGGTPVFRDAFSIGRGWCPPVFWVDGVRMSTWQSVMDLATLDIELIEAYKSPAGMPPEYIDSNSRCGVVVVWTRRGSGLPLSAIVEALEGRPGGGG